MALKVRVSSLDDVAEEHKNLYVEKKDASGQAYYVLDIHGVDDHPDVVNLKSAHERTKKEKRDALAERDSFKARLEGLPEDFNADQYTALKAAAEGKGVPTPEQLENVRKDERTKMQKELDKRDARIQKLEGRGTKRVVDEGLTRALAEAGVPKELMPMARSYLKDKGKIKVEEDEDIDDFVARVDTEMGPVDINKFVNDWLASDEGKPFIKQASGGGAEGSNSRQTVGKNPFDKKGGTWNVTEQSELLKTNPARAKQLAAQVGYTIPAPIETAA